MSITFTPVAPTGAPIALPGATSPCLCTQCDDAFFEAMDLGESAVYSAALLTRLAAAAADDCPVCKGCGVEIYERKMEINFSNLNARVIIRYLDLPDADHGTIGLTDFMASVAKTIRNLEAIGVSPAADSGIDFTEGTLLGARSLHGTLTLEGLLSRLHRMAELARTARAAGAAEVVWS